MKRVLDRIRSGRLGVVGIVLLVLIVLVVAHALVMGGGHGDEAVCGSCVVVIATGLAAVVALTPRRASTGLVSSVRWTPRVAAPVHPLLRPPLLRSRVLRL